jgi:spermidine/putrescine transport system permease protein
MKTVKKQGKGRMLAALPMSIWATVFVALALLYIIGLSFLSRGENFNVSLSLTADNYLRMAAPVYVKSLLLSLRLAFLTASSCALLGYPLAYFIAKTSPKVRTWLLILIIAPFWTNALIRIYGWKILFIANGPLNSILLSLGLIEKPLRLLYTEKAVLVGMIYAMIPFFVLPVYSGIERLDNSIVEASRDLGAGPVRAFFTVTLPMTMPSVLAALVLTFIPSIGLFFISDLLGGSNTMLWGNVIQNELLKSRDLPFASALSVVLLTLTGIVLVVYRKLGGDAESMVF